MLTEAEWQQLQPTLHRYLADVQEYRQAHGVGLSSALARNLAVPVLRHHARLTGTAAQDAATLWHHRLSLYGPPCASCGKPLRTPRAAACAACGVVVAQVGT